MTGSFLSVFNGAADIERDESEQPVIRHFGEELLATAAVFDEFFRQAHFFPDQLVDLLFYCTAANEFVNKNVAFLTDAEGAVGGLVFHRRVPPAVEVDDVAGLREIQSGAASL